MKRKLKALIIIVAVLAFLIIGGVIFVSTSYSAKFLLATIRFAIETLSDSNFIIYDLDFMEVCRDYADGDIEFEGDVIAGDIKDFNYTSSAKVHGVRSFDKKQMSATANAKVLFINVGDVEIYERDNTIYAIVPSFDNLAYSLTTNTNLFWQAPRLNSNLSLDWFSDNAANFIAFANDMDIVRTDNKIEDSDGTVSYEYAMTIPEGKGIFIWEMLGMNVPDHDVHLSMYLNNMCKIRRIVIDIGNIAPGTILTVDGTALGTCIIDKTLADDEKVTVAITRRGDYLYAGYLDVWALYETKDETKIKLSGVVSYNKTDNGYDVLIKRLKMYKDESLIGQMYFDGNVHTTKIDTPPIASAAVPLESVKHYEWEELRDNFRGIIDDIMDDVREKL